MYRHYLFKIWKKKALKPLFSRHVKICIKSTTFSSKIFLKIPKSGYNKLETKAKLLQTNINKYLTCPTSSPIKKKQINNKNQNITRQTKIPRKLMHCLSQKALPVINNATKWIFVFFFTSSECTTRNPHLSTNQPFCKQKTPIFLNHFQAEDKTERYTQ